MIFVTVGSQMPFDRLIEAVDSWASRNPKQEIQGQIARGRYRPQHFDACDFMSPEAFREAVFEADFVVAHAGMGVILTALEFGTPLVVMPRQGALGETRNDHQFATARHVCQRPSIEVAWDENQIPQRLRDLGALRPAPRITSHASIELLSALRAFVQHGDRPAMIPTADPVLSPARVAGAQEEEWRSADAA